jgi:hypothetical protein
MKMIIPNKKAFAKGFVMALVFVAVLVAMFMPLFDGENAFRAADALFNTISKGSTDYIDLLKETSAPHKKGQLDLTITLEEEATPAEVEQVLAVAGAEVTRNGDGLTVKAGLGQLIDAAIKDSRDMFQNDGETVKQRYDLDERHAMLAWWYGLRAIEKGLKHEERFAEAAYIAELLSRGVAVGYNYYQVEPQKASERWLILTGALLFYVVYTLWWGFAIFFMFEGFGLQLTAGKKKEV